MDYKEKTIDSVINAVEDWMGGNYSPEEHDFDSMTFTRFMRHELTVLTDQVRKEERVALREMVKESLSKVCDGNPETCKHTDRQGDMEEGRRLALSAILERVNPL